MSGRRSHVRFTVTRAPEGTFRVMRDVLVQRAGEGDVIAVSREAGVLGEVVDLEFPPDDAPAVRASVLESQPIVVNGSVRHRLRLRDIAPESSGDNGARTTRGRVDA